MPVEAHCIYYTMKHDRKLMERILKNAGLPEDLNPHLFLVQWFGGRDCVIEQHRGILDFSLHAIRLMTEQGVLTIEGEDLVLVQMTAVRAKVSGQIRSVALEAKS